MGLFRRDRPARQRPATPAARIAEFWGWWQQEGRRTAEATIAGQEDQEAFAQDVTRRLHRIDDGLAWELAPGDASAHRLVVSPGGDPRLRATARRVLLAAPGADETWSYADARPPHPDPEGIQLRLGDGPSLSLGDVRVAARLTGPRFDVTVHHPAFAELAPDARRQLVWLALDATLGEVDTEIWLGEVTPSEAAPLDAFSLTALRAVVHDQAGRHVDADGRPAWRLLRGDTPQGPVLASAQVPLHPATAPHLDTHVAVALPFDGHTDEGFPDEPALDALRDLEDRLTRALGTSGAVVAHQTSAGVRVLHTYVDSTTHALDTVRAAGQDWPGASVHDLHDPGWDSVRHLRD